MEHSVDVESSRYIYSLITLVSRVSDKIRLYLFSVIVAFVQHNCTEFNLGWLIIKFLAKCSRNLIIKLRLSRNYSIFIDADELLFGIILLTQEPVFYYEFC